MKKSRRVTKPATAPEVKTDEGLAAMIERLKASKIRKEADDRTEGMEAGRGWALHCSEYMELKHLVNLDRDAVLEIGHSEDPAEELASRMVESCGYDPSDSYCTHRTRDYLFPEPQTNYSADFILGFIDGAVGIWNKVKHQVETCGLKGG